MGVKRILQNRQLLQKIVLSSGAGLLVYILGSATEYLDISVDGFSPHQSLVLALFTGLLVLFLLDRHEKSLLSREVEKYKSLSNEMNHRLHLEKVISSISARFVNAEGIDEAIQRSLEEIGALSNASRSYLFLLRDDQTMMDNTHEWCAEGVTSQINNLKDIPCSTLPWWMETLLKDEIIYIEDVSDLPTAAAAEKEQWEAQNIKSLLVTPLKMKGSMVGFIGFDNISDVGGWHEDDFFLLRLCSEIISNVLYRREMEKALHKSYSELELRVQERTLELENINQALQKEISEHRETEEALLASEDRYRKLIDLMPNAVFLHHHGNCILANSAAAELLKASDTTHIIGKPILSFIHPDYRTSVESRIKEMNTARSRVPEMEQKMLRLDGTPIDVEVTASSIPYEDDAAILAVAQDITHRKEIEKALRSSKRRYRQLIEFLPDAVIMYNQEEIIFANRAAAHLAGLEDFHQLIGKDVMDLIPHDRQPAHIQAVKHALDKNEILPMVNGKFKRMDGTIIDVEITMTPYFYDSSPVILVIMRDMSERERAKALNKLLSETLEYDKLKTEFFANISHEFRTPLNVLLGAIQLFELMLKRPDESLQPINLAKYIHMMRQNCYRLLRLVNNLIDITRIDTGFFEISLKNCNLAGIISDICMSVTEYIENKGIHFQFTTDTAEQIIACDPDKIERIMLNLLSNAVKFTEPGGQITVDLRRGEESFFISIKDTGIGISQDKLEIIFERFRQVDKSLTRNHEGSGIGLSLVKSLVELHQGSITVKSCEGEGSEFIIQLPIRAVEDVPQLPSGEYLHQTPVEKIKVEFSDIYSNH